MSTLQLLLLLRSLDSSISTACDAKSSGADAGRISELQSLVLESTDLCQAATDRAKTAEERMQQVRVLLVPFATGLFFLINGS